MTVRCGRIDVHKHHTWTRPRTLRTFRAVRARTYDCPGTVLVAGGERKHP